MAKSSFSMAPARIKCIGCGGGGCNAITRMVREGIKGVEFVCMNTDAQALALSEVSVRVQLGEKLTRGLGAGGDHTVGEKSAEESRQAIMDVVSGTDMVFITAGMGGGTGTGSIGVVADCAKQSGALTIGIVTKPFSFEGARRSRVAEEAILKLADKVDTLIIIPNDRILEMCDSKTSVDNAFKLSDDVLKMGVQAIAEVVTVPGLINLDFADIRSIMKNAGPAWMSLGRANGQNRAAEAAKKALESPMLDVSISGAKGVLYNITGGNDMTLFECNEAAEVISQAVDPEANIIFGVVYNQELEGQLQITIIATGFTAHYGAAVPTETELRRLMRGVGEESLDVPSFLRRSASKFTPAAQVKSFANPHASQSQPGNAFANPMDRRTPPMR
ncbi:MAG TPA: cell division protein FtsZ [Dehalococcoidia bacterium]|nr:cell division protein FtsZ [Dehalococcoidia bacterium]